MRNYKADLTFFFLIILLLMLGCIKPDKNATADKFFKAYPDSNDVAAGNVFYLKDGGFVIITLSGDHPVIYRIDKNGNRINTKYPQVAFTQETKILREGEENFIISSSKRRGIYKININGEVLWQYQYPKLSFNITSQPCADEVGNYYYSYVNQNNFIDTPNGNFLVQFTNSGTLTQTIRWVTDTAKWKFYPKEFNVYHVDNAAGDKYFCGTGYPTDWIKIPQDNKIYLMHLAKDNTFTINYFDKTKTDYSQRNITQYWQNENADLLILATTQNDLGSYIQFIKTDNKMMEVWNKYYQVNSASSIGLYFKILNDGSYLICGCNINFSKSIPFLLKVDANGNKLWERTYPGVISGQIGGCAELPDGSLIITGSSNSFGFGKSGSEAFLIKTDKDGNL